VLSFLFRTCVNQWCAACDMRFRHPAGLANVQLPWTPRPQGHRPQRVVRRALPPQINRGRYFEVDPEINGGGGRHDWWWRLHVKPGSWRFQLV